MNIKSHIILFTLIQCYRIFHREKFLPPFELSANKCWTQMKLVLLFPEYWQLGEIYSSF